MGLIAHAAPTAKAEVQMCTARDVEAMSRAGDVEAMLAEERRKNEKLLQEMASLELVKWL